MSKPSLRIFLVPVFLLVILPIQLSGANYLSKLYCAFLGNENVTPAYQVIAREALAAFGVHDFEAVPVKRMAQLPKKMLGDGVVSFTMQGIWIDEELLMECPLEEVIFTIYYEAAHYALRDHAKELLLLIPASLIFYGVPHTTMRFIDPEFHWTRIGYVGAASLLMIAVIDRVLMRPTVRKIERKAEREAARVLCISGKQYIVQGHVNYLQSLIKQGEESTGLWIDSLADRIQDVTACLQEFPTE